MPAAPEVLDAGRFVGAVEVVGELKAEEQGRADGDVGVGREVHVHLHRVAVEAEQDVHGGQHVGGVEGALDEVDAEVVGDGDLLEEADGDEPHRAARLLRGQVGAAADLRQEVDGAHDGAGDELREVADEEGEAREVQLGRAPPAVDVDRVRHRLEGVEADAGREQDVEAREGQVGAGGVGDVDEGLVEEVRVLEDAEQPEVHDQADDEPELTPRGAVVVAGHLPPGDVVGHRRGEDEEDEVRVGGRVEDPARDQQKQDAQRPGPGQQPVDEEYDHQEDAVIQTVEGHGLYPLRAPAMAGRSPGRGWRTPWGRRAAFL